MRRSYWNIILRLEKGYYMLSYAKFGGKKVFPKFVLFYFHLNSFESFFFVNFRDVHFYLPCVEHVAFPLIEHNVFHLYLLFLIIFIFLDNTEKKKNVVL